MEIKKVYINGEKTNLVVDGVDIKNDELFLRVHRKQDEFSELAKLIGNPNLTATEGIENKMRKLFKKESWILHQVDFNFGYVTFALTTPNHITYDHVSMALDLGTPEPPRVVPLMQLDNSDKSLHTWIYAINCRNDYFASERGWPETMPVFIGDVNVFE